MPIRATSHVQEGDWILGAYQQTEPSRWEALCSGLRSGLQGRRWDAGDLVIAGLVLLVVVALIGVLSYLLLIQDRHRVYHGPRRLFLSLCRAHGLSWRQRWWLWRMARIQRLREPARLFLEPERFSATHISPALRRRSAALAQLRERLFREPARPLTAPAAGKPEDRSRPNTPLPLTAPPPTIELPESSVSRQVAQ